MPETVYAIHNFEAEADDEISFHIGEPIIVIQKDDLYQDGWWEGTNVRGETGLFPMNYTVQDPPEQGPSDIEPKQNSENAYNYNANGNGNGNNNKHNQNNHVNNNNNKMNGDYVQNLNGGMNNMHINQNPSISSPPLGSARNAFGNSSSGFSAPSGSSGGKVSPQVIEDSLNNPELAGHPSNWSIDQVAFWLRWCGFDNVAPSFIDNEISGAILLELNLNNLKELEINSFGKRFNIMNAITTLKQSTKGDKGSNSQYPGSPNPMYNGVGGPNIPPRLASAGGPSPRSSYDPRNEYMPDSRQNYQDPRVAPMSPPASIQSPTMRSQQQHQQHQPTDFEMPRSPPLARSDTLGSSGGSIDPNRGAQRQSFTSAYSTGSNPQRGQWDRNGQRPPQMPSPAPPQGRGLNPMIAEEPYGAHPMDNQMDMYQGMDGPANPEMHYEEPFVHEPEQSQRKHHVPDNTNNRQMNGKADPNDKVVSLERIGKPDYAGWLKKKGDTYRTWKSRWFMLKGVTLYYMNSPKDNSSKDYINLVGYKIIQDENIYAGKYCFKAVHEELRNFYFYTESEHDMKGWLKALMKVTIGRDPTAPVISSSNIPTIPLHVARRMAPRPPSPNRRNRGAPANGQQAHPQQQQNRQQQQQQQQQEQFEQQQYEQRFQQQQQQQQQQRHDQLQLDYDDNQGEEYHQDGYTSPTHGRHNQGDFSHQQQQQHQQHQQQQRLSFLQPEGGNGRGNDDDPWRDEDHESYGQPPQQRHQQQHSNSSRPDSELDSFRRHGSGEQSPNHHNQGGHWTQEQYIDWINRNLPDSVEPVNDTTQSLRSGVVLVRLVEQLSGEQVDKRIPNATYTLQMLENLLTAFKFMDRVGISTDGYTVKDIFNGNEEKIVQMFENIRSRFPQDAPRHVNGNSRLQSQNTGGSEYENLYDEIARGTQG